MKTALDKTQELVLEDPEFNKNQGTRIPQPSKPEVRMKTAHDKTQELGIQEVAHPPDKESKKTCHASTDGTSPKDAYRRQSTDR
jgi:hypothetical protein